MEDGKSQAAFNAGAGFLSLPRLFRMPVWLLIAFGTLATSLAGLVAGGLGENGFRLASQLAWRLAMIVYLLAIMAGPLGRLIPFAGMRALYQERRQLLWGFLASFGVFLVSVLLPNTFPWPQIHAGLDGGMLLFLMFGAGLTAVTAYAANPQAALHVGEKARRALLGVGLSYFWLAYLLSSLSHFSDRDLFTALSLTFLAAALLLRVADWLAQRVHSRR